MTISLAAVVRAHVDGNPHIRTVVVNSRDSETVANALRGCDRRPLVMGDPTVPAGCYRVIEDEQARRRVA